MDISKEFNLPTGQLGVKTRTYLFLPSEHKDMKIEYPELAEINEFAVLTNSELILVWCLANASSPYELSKAGDDKTKAVNLIKSALETSGLGKKLSDLEKNYYLTFMYPQKVKTAMQRMKLFRPSLRMKAKLMNEKMFENMEKMVDIAQEELQEMSSSDKLEYLKIVKAATENLQTLVPEIEASYGIKEVKKKSGATTTAQPTIMDQILSAD